LAGLLTLYSTTEFRMFPSSDAIAHITSREPQNFILRRRKDVVAESHELRDTDSCQLEAMTALEQRDHIAQFHAEIAKLFDTSQPIRSP
jgi:hypothetical protein